MNLEERLTTHFQSTSKDLHGPDLEIGTIMTAAESRSMLPKVVVGGGLALLGLAVVGFGLAFALSRGASLPLLDDRPDNTRVVVSPFVNVQSRLTGQTDDELFTVTTDSPAYWRIATLSTYEDDIWKAAGSFTEWTGPEPEPEGLHHETQQEFEIKNLEAIWLPAAAEPIEIIRSDVPITFAREAGHLTVNFEQETSDGLTYTIVSAQATPTPDQLRNAPPPDPLSVLGSSDITFADVPPQVGVLAREITAGQPTDYDKVLALQNHFREYDYSDELGPRAPGTDPTTQFLKERQGFSQHFSGTFALMARELGIPSRVAIGFTWGDPIGEDLATSEEGSTTYSVTGRHTHAWPEVYFEGIGWVAFEPTPGRGMPGTVVYTGVAAEQDSGQPPGQVAGD